MRRVLVDFARAKSSQKRGGGAVHVTLDEKADLPHEREADIVALDEALERLAKLNRRHVQIVELRYFGGLSEEEIAEVLNVSSRTVRRDWNLARAWLFRELRRGHDDAGKMGKDQPALPLRCRACACRSAGLSRARVLRRRDAHPRDRIAA
jgi:DNA-directed RNA polymerase specialized sigma24 family protein